MIKNKIRPRYYSYEISKNHLNIVSAFLCIQMRIEHDSETADYKRNTVLA